MLFQKFPAAILLFGAALCLLNPALRGQDDFKTGVTAFRIGTTNLYGTGIRVAQAEATNNPPPLESYEVNPANVGSPAGIFTYISTYGTSSTYPNTVGTNSDHAEWVAKFFYGTVSPPGQTSAGIATNIAHVDVLDANYFFNNFVDQYTPQSLGDAIINQSYKYSATLPGNQTSITNQQLLDTLFDNYGAYFNVLLVGAVGKTGHPGAPGTGYNCISVGAYNGPDNVGGDSATGPTVDNSRCKPDIVAPDQNTSFAVPQVAGSAAVLLQAAERGDGGTPTNSAADMRTLKALLLNGAVKQTDWTNGPSTPLDARFGAGMLNLYNSYRQLAGGRQTNFVSTTVTVNAAHPPTTATNTIAALSGWSFATNTSSATSDAINHYCFNVTNGSAKTVFLTAATLVWNRQYYPYFTPYYSPIKGINNLRLYLYNTANSNLVACSTSTVDNVQHIWLTSLVPGRYDLQVWKAGGSTVSTAEPYALAFAFMPTPTLVMGKSGTNVTVSWPAYPCGYLAESATNVAPAPVWSTNNLLNFSVTNQMNVLPLAATNKTQFFRLVCPNF